MLTRHRSFAILVTVLILAASFTIIGIPSARAADLSLGFTGQGVYPQAATACSQRWFRVHVTYDGTINDDGVPNERITGLYLDRGIAYNNNVALPAAPSGETYYSELTTSEGLWDAGLRGGLLGTIRLTVVASTTKVYYVTPLSVYYYPGQLTGYTLTITSGLGDTNQYDITDNDADAGGTYLTLDGATPLDDEVCADLEVLSNPTTTRVYYDPVPAVSYYSDNTLGGMLLRFTEGEAAGQEFDIVGNGQNPSGYYIDVSGDTALPAALMQQDDADSIPTTTKFYYSTISFGEAFLVGHTLVITSGTANGNERQISYNGEDGTGTYIITTTNLPAGFAATDTFTIKDIMHVCDTAELENLAAALDQPEYFGVARYTVAGYPDYNVGFTVGPFAGHHYEYLVGRVHTGHSSPTEPIELRFTLYWELWNAAEEVKAYEWQDPVRVTATYVTVPLALPWGSYPYSPYAGVSEVHHSFEQAAWYTGDVGGGVDPLVVTEGEEGTNIDNGSGSANYTYRVAYKSERSDLPPVWRVTSDRTMPPEDYPYVRLDNYVEEGLRNDDWTQYWRKWSHWDTWYDWHVWIYWEGDDPHYDYLGAQHSARNPEAVLIVDDNYDRPFYMERESGSFAGTVVYRYDIRPTNYLQLLNNIFLFAFDPAGPDAWDFHCPLVYNGRPLSNAYVSMRAGGHKYQFITTRDWDPPIWALSHSGPGTSHSQVGPCSVVLASRPGDSLTAQHVLNDSTNAGTIADPEVVSEDVYEWFDDQAGGGYGYPYDSQLADRYPKVDPVLTAHPYFEEGPLTGPNSVERGYPWRWSLESGIGPRMAGSLPSPFNPDGNTAEPWGALVGPKYPQISNPSSAPVNVYGGYNPGSPLNPNATGESPERFTNQGTIWPNYVNIWGDISYDPDLSQPSGFRGGKWTTTTDFVFRINYWQSDNLEPGAIQLFVRKVGQDGSPLTSWMGYSMSKVYPTDNTYTDGCLYYEELNSVQLPGGGAGDYQYYFRASDGVRTAIYPNRPDDDFGYIGVPPGGNDYYWFRVNNRPTLANQSLEPVSGPQRGDFSWEVTYADQDGEVYDAGHAGDPPFKTILWIDLFGDIEGQAEVNGAPSGNVITYTVPGTAYADNALVGMKVRMQTGAEAGQQFTITANDQSASTITATGVSTSGIADGDLFNIADWFAGTMDAVNPGDTNYRDGALYDFSTARAGVQLDPGIHHYYFEFWDNWAYWINWQQYFMTSDPDPIDYKVEGQMRRLPAAGYYEGPEVLAETPPILSSYYFAPPVADQITGVDVGTDTIEYDRAGDLPGYGTDAVQTMYLEILGGFAQFKVFPILSNTDTEIELDTTSTSIDGVQVGNRFRIYEQRTQDTSTGKWYQSWAYDTDPGGADDYDGTPATPFYFYVLYTDADNNAPQAIRLQIDDDAGQVYEMEKVVPGDINYAAGVLYRTSDQVYLLEGSHTFEAQAWDGASWYNNGNASDFWGPYGYTGTAANGPDIAPNAAPQLSFKVGENLEIASVDPTDPYIFTYTEPTDPDEALGDDPITAVYISAVGHNYSTDAPGGGYVVKSHDPDTNTIELADDSLDLSSNVSDTFTAAAELVPRTGFSDQTYRYYVVYTDTDTYAGTTGNPATFVNAYIDAAEYAMGEYDPTDLDVSDGKVYYYDMSSLSPSPAHTYYFMASDGVDNVRFPPHPDYFEGPAVTVNGPPDPPPYPPADGWSPINGVSVDTQTPTLDWPNGSDDDPWDSPSSFTYIVQLSMTADFSTVDYEYDTTDYGGPGITELDVPDDLDWAWWYWRVQTVDGHGLGSAWSAIHYFKVDQTPQPPASGFSPASAPAPAGTIGTLTPTLQWDPGTDPDADDPPEDMRYHVELDDDADFTSPIVSPDLGGPGDPEYGVTGVGVTSFQIDITLGLEANTPYHWRVRTVNGLESAWSATQTFTVVIPTYSLSGTIYDSDTVTPLEGVTVECYNSLAVKVREQDTEADGEYEFTGLPADTYQVVPVFDPFSFTPVGSDDHVTIVDSDITDFDFNLVDGAYKITGTITITGGGGPLEDAVVSIGVRSDDTDASGYYEITGLPDGNYTLAVTALAGQYYTFTPDGWSPPVIISGGDETGKDFDADEETFDISGTVKDYDANLLSGIDIDAVKVGAPSSTASTTTAGNGTYTLADLSAGDWEITATDPGDTFVFVPSLATVTVPGPGGSDVEDIDFTGYPGSEHSYAVGLHLTGVPVYPIEGYAEDVFLSSDIWWWHPSGGVYIGTGHPDAGSLLQVQPGTGFFVNYGSATDIKVAGTAVPTGVPFVKNLGPAWNMIGNPFAGHRLPMANIQPDTGHAILPFAYIYDSFSGSYLLVTDQAGIGVARSYLEPWEGAWLYACTGTNFTISMTAGLAVTAAAAGEEVGPQALDTGQAGWAIPVLAHVGNRSDLMGAIGISSIEPYSLPNPPAALNSVDLYFVGDDGSQLAQSVVSPTGDTASWEFVVATDIPDSQVEVALPDLSQLPNDLAVTLTDLDADRSVYARTMPSYSFRSGENGAVRHFRIEVGPKQAGGLAITTAAAQPGGSGAVITYGVSQACTVTVEIMNISGRVIKTLVIGEAATAGTHALSWNLRSNSGTVVPRGMYLVRIDAAAENGQRTSRLCQLNVNR